jgi:hypothetical protein
LSRRRATTNVRFNVSIARSRQSALGYELPFTVSRFAAIAADL